MSERKTSVSRPRSKRGATLSKEMIVDAAIRLIDSEGLANFGIRSVAKAVGVFPTAVYWYVPSRHALIAEVITVVLADLVPSDDLPWQEWVRALFTRYREIIRRHPNVAPLIGAQLVSNVSVDLNLIERTLSKLGSAGFRDGELVAAFNAVIGGMIGFVTQEFAMVAAPEKDGDLKEVMLRSLGGIDAARYPQLARNIPNLLNAAYTLRWDNGSSAPLDSGFELYTDALIAGLAARIARSGK